MLAIAKAMLAIHTMRPPDVLEEVQHLSQQYVRSSVLRGLVGYTFGAAGQVERAKQVLESLCTKGGSPNCWYAKALVMVSLGRIRETVDTLKECGSAFSIWRLGHQTDRLLAPLTRDAEFQEMVASCLPNDRTGRADRAA